jgi:hypothetical protein
MNRFAAVFRSARTAALASFVFAAAMGADAQTYQDSGGTDVSAHVMLAVVVASCGGSSFSAGAIHPLQMTTAGLLCVSG